MADEVPKCQLCGEPMPPGEEMFNYHGTSGPCPKPPLEKPAPGRLSGERLQGLLLAGTDEVRAMARELLDHRRYDEPYAALVDKFRNSLEQIKEHFDAEWSIKGEGQWRLRVIAEHLKAMDDAYNAVIERDQD